MKRVRSEDNDYDKWPTYRIAILITIGGNIFLFILKGIMAWITGSSAIFSDAANSLSDVLYSIFLGMGLYISQRPADETHPQGHDQFEPLVSLFVAAAMWLTGATAIWQSVRRFLGAEVSIRLGWPTVVLIVAVITKIVMYKFLKYLGDESGSPALKATASDNLADVTVSTVALIGIWSSRFLHPQLDSVAGFLVGLWIFNSAYKITRENIDYLTGKGAPRELTDKIAEVALEVPEVQDVHRVIAEYVGPGLRVDMHINIDGGIKLQRAHDIGEDVRLKVKEISGVDLVFIHIEPIESTI